MEPVYAGTFRRAFLANRDWSTLDPLDLVMSADSAQMVRKGSTREVVALQVEADSPASQLLNIWSEARIREPEIEAQDAGER